MKMASGHPPPGHPHPTRVTQRSSRGSRQLQRQLQSIMVHRHQALAAAVTTAPGAGGHGYGATIQAAAAATPPPPHTPTFGARTSVLLGHGHHQVANHHVLLRIPRALRTQVTLRGVYVLWWYGDEMGADGTVMVQCWRSDGTMMMQ